MGLLSKVAERYRGGNKKLSNPPTKNLADLQYSFSSVIKCIQILIGHLEAVEYKVYSCLSCIWGPGDFRRFGGRNCRNQPEEAFVMCEWSNSPSTYWWSRGRWVVIFLKKNLQKPMVFGTFPVSPKNSSRGEIMGLPRLIKFTNCFAGKLQATCPQKTPFNWLKICTNLAPTVYGGFHKCYPNSWIVHRGKGESLLKWMIWGYPHFRKPPYHTSDIFWSEWRGTSSEVPNVDDLLSAYH